MRTPRCPIDDLTLSAYLDREVGRIAHYRIARHLERCPRCRGRYDRLRRADAIALLSMTPSIAAWSAPQSGLPDDSIDDPVGERAAAGMRGRRRFEDRVARRRRRLVGVAALALVAVAAGVAITDPSRRTTEALYRLDDRNADRAAHLLNEARVLADTIALLRAELVSSDLPIGDRRRIEDGIARCAAELQLLRASARGVDRAEGGR